MVVSTIQIQHAESYRCVLRAIPALKLPQLLNYPRPPNKWECVSGPSKNTDKGVPVYTMDSQVRQADGVVVRQHGAHHCVACLVIGHQLPRVRTLCRLTWVWLKINNRGFAGFGPCFHLPGFHFGTGFLSHSHMLSGQTCCGWLRNPVRTA